MQVTHQAYRKAIMLILMAQWLGALTGVPGSYLVGSQTRHQRQCGFALFLISNACWLYMAIATSTGGLLAMNLAYTVTSIRGSPTPWYRRPQG